MIYSKTTGLQDTHNMAFLPLAHLDDAQLEPNSIYWYDQHDWAVHKLMFTNALEEKHWDHIRRDPTTKILLFFGDEYFNTTDIDMFANTIKERNVDPEQVYLVTIDENWSRWAKESLEQRGVVGVHIQDYNILLQRTKVDVPQVEGPTKHKFSSFSRNYNLWRLQIFAELRKRNLLHHFNYTFNNLNPYVTPMQVIDKDHLKKTLSSLNYKGMSIETWVDGMPYSFPEIPVHDKWNDQTYVGIQESDIHLLIESHFDPFLNFQGHRNTIDPDVFSPAFPTEKTYKVMISERPFIAFTTPFFMKELQLLGYKTFAPFIDESYDNIVDDAQRLQAIASEVERLAKLDTDVYNKVLEGCKEIAIHNRNLILEKRESIKFNDKFEWIYPFFNTHIVPIPGRVE